MTPDEEETIINPHDNTAKDCISKYKIISELGRGGMGVVYLAHDPDLERNVAIKVLRMEVQTSGGEQDEFIERFQREARVVAQLNHPNIIVVHEVGQDNNTMFIVMEYVEGKTLREIINEKKLTVADKVDLMKQMCAGLHAAHDKGLVHRDIKPTNIIVTKDNLVKIMDFGLTQTSDSELTRTHQVMGTPNYMSPEQLLDTSNVDLRSDIFSLGVVFYELLAGEKAFPGNSIPAITHRIITETPAPPSKLNPVSGSSLDETILKSINKNPEERFASCQEMAHSFLPIQTAIQNKYTISSPAVQTPNQTNADLHTKMIDRMTSFHKSLVKKIYIEGNILWSIGLVSFGLYSLFVIKYLMYKHHDFIVTMLKDNSLPVQSSSPRLQFNNTIYYLSTGLFLAGFGMLLWIILNFASINTISYSTVGQQTFQTITNTLTPSLICLWAGIVLFLGWFCHQARKIDEWKQNNMFDLSKYPEIIRVEEKHISLYELFMQQIMVLCLFFGLNIIVLLRFWDFSYRKLINNNFTIWDMFGFILIAVSYYFLTFQGWHSLMKDILWLFIDKRTAKTANQFRYTKTKDDDTGIRWFYPVMFITLALNGITLFVIHQNNIYLFFNKYVFS